MLDKTYLEGVAIRLATWQERGWVPQSMDIIELKGGERFAEWRDTQGRRWTANLAANENYVVLPLHCREVCLSEERVVLTPQRLERARVWIADMVEFI